MENKKVTGFILAGGKSSRMKTDKGLLDLGGKKMIQWVIDAIMSFVDDIIIISNVDKYNEFGFPVQGDIILGSGPMGGIYTALTMSKTKKNLIVSCDMPFLTSEIITKLINDPNNAEVTIPVHAEEPEPLCAVYDTLCKIRFEELLKSGEWKLIDSLKYFRVSPVVFDNTPEVIRAFSNINTPLEYKNLQNTGYEYTR